FIRAKDGDQVICHTFLCKPQHLRVDLSKNDSSEHIGEFRWVTKEEFLSSAYAVSHHSLKQLITNQL
ncbi:hypothetical protein HZB02_02790, partial [Candidatus Woesearchaeota archaeon]|nr:hypothetical protein [Candidatus Woesearchaeota archaeon]